MERIAAVLDTYVEELLSGELCSVQGGAEWAYVKREEGDVLIAMVDIVYDCHGCFSRPAR